MIKLYITKLKHDNDKQRADVVIGSLNADTRKNTGREAKQKTQHEPRPGTITHFAGRYIVPQIIANNHVNMIIYHNNAHPH